MDHQQTHYNSAKDPLYTSNLGNDVLEPLQEVLSSGDVRIKHIVLVKLESNRQDVFPLRKDSYFMERVKESHKRDRIPPNVERRLSNLTRTAELLTGSETGFDEDKDGPQPYGGINAKNAYTTGTYTLKSITGTVCGVVPLPLNYNREFLYHIYQPCLPHIFEALNHQPSITSNADDWTSWPWHNMWMQSVNGDFDQQTRLMPVLGFKDLMTAEVIEEAGGPDAPEPWAFEAGRGYMDKVLKNYLRRVVADAKRNNTRLFLSHLTGATHRPWSIPRYSFEEFLGNRWYALNDRMNRQLNTFAYQDGWLATVVEILRDEGIADETLLVMVGDQ